MKTLKCLIVRQTEMSRGRKREIEMARTAMEKYSLGKLKVEFEYRIIPNFLKGVKLENGNSDIDEEWVRAKLDDYRYRS